MDIDRDALNLAFSLQSPSESVLLTDASGVLVPMPDDPRGYKFEAQNHPGHWPGTSYQYAGGTREGNNVTTLDGGVRWVDEADTKPRFLYGVGGGYNAWRVF